MSKEWIQKLMVAGKVLGYAFFAIVVFFLGFRFSFPDAVIKGVIRKLAAAQHINIRVKEASLSGILGVDLKDVSVIKDKFRFSVDEVEASLGVFSTIFSGPSGSITVKKGGGYIGPLYFKKSKKKIYLNLKEVKDFPLKNIPVKIGKFVGIIKKLKINMEYPLSKWWLYNTKGIIEFEIANTALLDPKVDVPNLGKFEFTSMGLGTISGRFYIGRRAEIPTLRKYRGVRSKDRVINFARFNIDGRDLKLYTVPTSTITIPKGSPLVYGMMNMEIAFHIMNHFFVKKIKKNGKLEQPNLGLRTVLGLSPQWKRAFYKGFYGLICTGIVKKPRCFPKRPNIRKLPFKLPKKEQQPITLGLSKPEETKKKINDTPEIKDKTSSNSNAPKIIEVYRKRRDEPPVENPETPRIKIHIPAVKHLPGAVKIPKFPLLPVRRFH